MKTYTDMIKDSVYFCQVAAVFFFFLAVLFTCCFCIFLHLQQTLLWLKYPASDRMILNITLSDQGKHFTAKTNSGPNQREIL